MAALRQIKRFISKKFNPWKLVKKGLNEETNEEMTGLGPHDSKIYKYFAVEIMIFIIALFVIGGNVAIRAQKASGQAQNQSLFFTHLKQNKDINPAVVDAYQTVNIKVAQGLNRPQQVLAATAGGHNSETDDSTPLPSLSGSALLKPNPASATGPVARRDIQVHEVQSGETISAIALTYGVSETTILTENNLSSSSLIRPGQELKILPVSGVKHTIQSGETLFSIAEQYGVSDIEAILDFNNIEFPELIYSGETIIIPNGIKKAEPSPSSQQYLAGLQRSDVETATVPEDFTGAGSQGMIWPIPGHGRISQNYWSRHRALDIPGNRASVVASADGIVELAGWQGGYGYTIVVNHGNGFKTRYAHASQLLVSAGQEVKQGQTIMVSGSTGRSTGPHLHFEVLQNGAFVNPLSVVSR